MIDTYKVPHRIELGRILQQRGYRGIGVEVGVEHGIFSDILLSTTQLQLLVSLDRWSDTDMMLDTMSFLGSKHGERSACLRGYSVPVSRAFFNRSLDFVYLDAGHAFFQIQEDLECWWPKIKRGGMFAGHDYTDEPFYTSPGNYGVLEAVNQFVAKRNLRLYITGEREGWGMKSWYCFKPLNNRGI